MGQTIVATVAVLNRTVSAYSGVEAERSRQFSSDATRFEGYTRSLMLSDWEEAELSRLHKQQVKTGHDQVFGGLSPAERSAYENRRLRIRELENHLSMAPGKLELLT